MKFFSLYYTLKLFHFFHAVGICVQAILLGREVKRIEDFNFMSALRFYQPDSEDPFYLCVCGAAVVSEWKVVTAAHCVTGGSHPVALNFGSLDIEYPKYSVNISWGQITIHPKYNYSSKMFDVAVIEPHEKLPFSSQIGKIDMADRNDNVLTIGAAVIMLGYTTSNDTKRVYDRTPLQYIESTIANFTKCAEAYWQKSAYRLNSDTEFCIDLCNGTHCTNGGDSGGCSSDSYFLRK